MFPSLSCLAWYSPWISSSGSGFLTRSLVNAYVLYRYFLTLSLSYKMNSDLKISLKGGSRYPRLICKKKLLISMSSYGRMALAQNKTTNIYDVLDMELCRNRQELILAVKYPLFLQGRSRQLKGPKFLPCLQRLLLKTVFCAYAVTQSTL